MIHRISIRTGTKVELREITGDVQNVVDSSGIESGVGYIFVPHTTAAVTVNEHADTSVVEDIIAQLETVIPLHNKYRHMEGNSPAHIKASMMGNSVMLPIEGKRLVLGTWQGIFFCEFDGPRNRTYLVKVVPDKL